MNFSLRYVSRAIMSRQIKNIRIDDRIDAYRPFFDHAWASNLDKLTKFRPKLDEAIFDLILDFKGISFTSAMPLLAIDVAESYASGFNLHKMPQPLAIQLARCIAMEINQQAFFLEPHQKAQVAQTVSAAHANQERSCV